MRSFAVFFVVLLTLIVPSRETYGPFSPKLPYSSIGSFVDKNALNVGRKTYFCEAYMAVLKNFIVIEGIDGAGTTTQLNLLRERVAGVQNPGGGDAWLFTAEPTGLPTGRFLRQVLASSVTLHPATTAYLFAADRQEHLAGSGGILEALAAGRTVVSDRYLFSSLAYQSTTCGADLPRLLNSPFPLPELLVFLRIDPAAALARIAGRNQAREIYEQQAFLEQTAAAYEAVLAAYAASTPDMRIVALDGTAPPEVVAGAIAGAVGARGTTTPGR
jgi:dTMP kinase